MSANNGSRPTDTGSAAKPVVDEGAPVDEYFPSDERGLVGPPQNGGDARESMPSSPSMRPLVTAAAAEEAGRGRGTASPRAGKSAVSM